MMREFGGCNYERMKFVKGIMRYAPIFIKLQVAAQGRENDACKTIGFTPSEVVGCRVADDFLIFGFVY